MNGSVTPLASVLSSVWITIRVIGLCRQLATEQKRFLGEIRDLPLALGVIFISVIGAIKIPKVGRILGEAINCPLEFSLEPKRLGGILRANRTFLSLSMKYCCLFDFIYIKVFCFAKFFFVLFIIMIFHLYYKLSIHRLYQKYQK